MRYLITGSRSGLGKFLYESIGGMGLHRDNAGEILKNKAHNACDVIIHCAYPSMRPGKMSEWPSFLKDSIFLTRRLLSIPHKKFIYLSSVDVYPKSAAPHREDEKISVLKKRNAHAFAKIVSERLVRLHSSNVLILRAAMLLGKYSRRNNLKKLIEGQTRGFSLAAESSINLVLHEDLLHFIEFAVEKDLRGIYNVAASENMFFSEAAEILGRKAEFGGFGYETGHIANEKIAAVFPIFKESSRQRLRHFLETEPLRTQ